MKFWVEKCKRQKIDRGERESQSWAQRVQCAQDKEINANCLGKSLSVIDDSVVAPHQGKNGKTLTRLTQPVVFYIGCM